MMAISRLFSRFLRDTHANILIMFAVAAPVLLGVAALGVGYNQYLTTSGYIQAAVDQAAVSAVAVDGQDREEVAKRFFNSSLTEDQKKSVTLNSIKVEENFPEGGPLSVKVTADISMKNHFGGFVGMETLQITRIGEATRGVHNVEAVLTLASSGTMCSHKNRIPNNTTAVRGDTLLQLSPDSRCEHFNAMKTGVNEFLRIVGENETVADFKLGLVPFNYKVRMPSTSMIPPSIANSEPAGFFTDMGGAEPISPVVPLTSSIDSLERAIVNLRQSPAGRAWSRSDLGTHVAALMLDPNSYNFFPGGRLPANFGDPETRKVLIMMTDGANIGCCFTNWQPGNFANQYVYHYDLYNQAQLEVCRLLKEQNVVIYSILFDVQRSDPGGAQIHNVFARCASGAYDDRGVEANPNAMLTCDKKQNCYDIRDDEQLIRAYQEIAQTFYQPVITE